MKQLFAILMMAVVFAGCATLHNGNRFGYGIVCDERCPGVRLYSFEPHDLMVKSKLKDCELEMLDSLDCAKKISSLPKGGNLEINLNGSTSGTADQRFIKIIITDMEGKKLYEHEPDDMSDIKVRIVQGVTEYYSSNWYYVYNELPDQFIVYVVSKIKEKRAKYTVTKNIS